MTTEIEKIPNKEKASWNSLIIIVILLLAMGAAGYFGFFYIQKFSSDLDEVQKKLIETNKNIDNLPSQIQSLTTEFNTQNETIKNLQQLQTNVTRDQWRIIEAEFLVKLANNKLEFENNVSEAIILLQTADEELQKLNDGRLLPIRKALASDITYLQTIPKIDIPGIYLRLLAINNEVNNLPLPNKPIPVKEIKLLQNENLPWWKRTIDSTWQALQKIVVIHYHEQGKLPLITPDQQDFLYQNLHSILLQAMWALIHQEPQIYQNNMKTALDWINKYFVPASPVTQSIVNNLKELMTIDINPNKQQIKASLEALQKFFSAENTKAEKTAPTKQP